MSVTADKILTIEQALSLRKQWKTKRLRVVFTNGCFDILHLGHIDYLEKARAKGDRMVVGLNADASVKRLKGEQRPVNDLYARARMLAALSFVDAVVAFEEDTPLLLIERLLPDVLIKGSDYSLDSIVGAGAVINSGGAVTTVDLVDGFSTTRLIEKIRSFA